MTTATQKIPSGYKQTDIGVIPADWGMKRLGDIVQFNNGKAHERFINDKGNYVVVNSKFISTEGEVFKTSDKNLSPLFDGEVVMVMSDIPHGRALAKCFFIRENGKYTLNQRICSFKSINSDSLYLFYKLNRNKYFLDFDSGVGQTNLRRIEVLNCPVAIPSNKKEQSAIATALSDTDALIEKLEKLIEKKKNIKHGVMQELLSGKRRLPGFSGEWNVVTYDEAFDFLRTAQYSREQLGKGETRYVHYGDIHTKWNCFVDLSNDLPTVEDELVGNYSLILDGDLIMADASEDYEGIGKSVEVKNEKAMLAISGLHTFLLRDKGNFFVKGFRGYIHLNRLVKSSMDRLATGLKVYGVSKSNLKLVQIPRPPLPEQAAIATVLSDMDTEIEKLESELTKYQNLKQGMMQVLLTGKIRLLSK